MKTTTKVFRIEDDILIITATTRGCAGRGYVSVTANRITPKKTEDIISDQREYLADGEYWRMAVEAKQTKLSLEDYNNQFDENELLEMADISLYPKSIMFRGDEYGFLSSSCGCLHEDIQEVTDIFDTLISMHLSEKDVPAAEILIQAIPGDDVDKEVEKQLKSIVMETYEV